MVATVASKFELLGPQMHERLRRRWAACEALSLGSGGISVVAEATGLSRTTIHKGIAEIRQDLPDLVEDCLRSRIRAQGGGRRRLVDKTPSLEADLKSLVDATTRGDPMCALLWTCKSTRMLAEELANLGHRISHMSVARLLDEMGYSLQANRKTEEGSSHPDRDAQFRHINKRVRACQRRRQPVISVDTKKKELVGNFKNSGREWHPKGSPKKVNGHDFRDRELGIAIPYGVYDLSRNEGWVSVGIDHDTAEFAVATIERWWRKMGRRVHPEAQELLITADGGGSNGSRSRLWKVCVQELADRLQLPVSVCHFPPGTSKWNKIEHRMFCHITENWRGRPLISRAVIVNLIGHTTTGKGLRIRAELDEGEYETGLEVTDEQLARINILKDRFHGEWNYTIHPRI
jgi:hypothetical protein